MDGAGLTTELGHRQAVTLSKPDIEFRELEGRVIINYSWGNRQGVDHLADAVFDGTLREFRLGWYA